MNNNIKYYISFEAVFFSVSLVYNFKLSSFNEKLLEWLASEHSTSWLVKSFKMFEYQDGQAFQYLYGAIAIIFIACILTSFFWIRYLRYYEADSMLFVSITSSLLNVFIIILTLVLISNPILWGFTILCVSGSFIMYTMSV